MKSRIRACVMGKGRKLTCTREGFKLAGKRGDEACTFGPVGLQLLDFGLVLGQQGKPMPGPLNRQRLLITFQSVVVPSIISIPSNSRIQLRSNLLV
ncbi:hypothetical protein ACFXTN_023744 [Malus domestica]